MWGGWRSETRTAKYFACIGPELIDAFVWAILLAHIGGSAKRIISEALKPCAHAPR